MATMLSGIIPACEQDEVMCPLLLRRHMIIPAWRTAFAAGAGCYV